jgi:type II secretory pathway component PulJ
MIQIAILAILSLLLFAYLRNRQAIRNDKRRERLWKKQEELNELLNNINKEDDQSDKTS